VRGDKKGVRSGMKQLSVLACLAAFTTACWPGLAHPDAAPVKMTFGSLAFEPCTLAQEAMAMTVAARCATLRVPEDRSQPGGRQLGIPIAWVPSSAKRAAPDPVFMLAGGPGQSALDAFPAVAPAFRDVLRQRDVILVDQRGTGRASTLACPKTLEDERWQSTIVVDPASAREMTQACLAEIKGADPRLYTTNDYVADLEAARTALGVAQVNLVGVSYGTRVALEYLRRHPAQIRTVVLDSVVPPTLILGAEHARNLDAAIDRQFALCAADKVCHERFGSPREKLDALLARLRAKPVEVSYLDPLTNERRTDTLTAESVSSVVRLHAYAPQQFAMVPMLLASAAEGRYEVMMSQARMIEEMLGDMISVGLQLSVSCAEDAPWLRADPADNDTLLGTSFVEFVRAQCEIWPRGSVPKDFHEPVKASNPVLLLSGEFDPVTPQRYGAEVARTLPNSRHLVLRGQGHSVMQIGCTPRLVSDFIERAEAQGLDASCLDQLTYVPPFTGPYGWEP
jgi:pimeloyl-ACP methyl ester carboxylesterase